ncbi:hypothetical protein BDR26DRAFT_150837 [Obelidium mucronatum]|nr:hypothetical protein BDR26DRAFT_150837 [Obelidium mucronatum]
MLQRILPKNMSKSLIFRQLFESESSTFTYFIADRDFPNDAVVIDPVDKTVDRDAKLAAELGVSIKFGLNTHCHADHITGTHLLRQKFPAMQSGISANAGSRADILLSGLSDYFCGKVCVGMSRHSRSYRWLYEFCASGSGKKASFCLYW